MWYLYSTIGCISILLSLCGYVYIVCKKMNISVFIAPIFVICSISLVIYFAGFLGIMYPISYLVFVVGIVLFGYVVTQRFDDILEYYDVMIVVAGFSLLFGLFLLLLYTTSVVHYDNYSHWMVVVKELLLSNHFIEAENLMVEFKNYPYGTACFLYYVCKIAGQTQGAMLFAQTLIIFTSFFACFAVIKEKKRFLLAIYMGAGLATLSYFNLTIRINNLLVDFILPILTLVSISTSYRYRFQINKALIVNASILGFLVIVKSTGVIFAAISMIYLIYLVVKDSYRQFKNNKLSIYLIISRFFIKIGIFILVTCIPNFLWQYYVATEFSGIENKFEMTTDKLSGIYAGKTAEDIQNIIRLYIQTLTDLTQRPTQGIVFYHVIAIIGLLVARIFYKKKWKVGKLLVLLDIVLICYFSGILSMYIYSMPLDEAIYLAGYERYASSIVVFFGGAVIIGITLDIQRSFHYRLDEVERYKAFKNIENKKMYNRCIVACFMVLYLMISSELNGIKYNNEMYHDSLVNTIQNLVGDSWEDVDMNRYLVYATDKDGQLTSYYGQYVTKYYLRAPYVDGICSFYEDNMKNLLNQYDKLLVLETDKDLIKLMKKHFNLDVTPGIYEIDELMINWKDK